MNEQRIRIPIKAWYGDETMDLNFPPQWQVHECRMAGHDTPPLSDQELYDALQSPIGTESLKELARGKKEAVILFDDLTRPAPTAQVLPLVLKELHDAGFTEDRDEPLGFWYDRLGPISVPEEH